MRKCKANKPKRHKAKVGDKVTFKHAGRFRRGVIIELTKQIDEHATYTVECNGIIYPQLGLNGSKWQGYVVIE
jgi:plastocyanin